MGGPQPSPAEGLQLRQERSPAIPPGNEVHGHQPAAADLAVLPIPLETSRSNGNVDFTGHRKLLFEIFQHDPRAFRAEVARYQDGESG